MLENGEKRSAESYDLHYVKDTLDFTKFAKGYEYKTWKEKKPCRYRIKPSEYVSLGNSGQALTGEIISDETKDELNDGDNAGVYFNREFAKEHAEGKAIYHWNWAYKKEISEKQLKAIIRVYKNRNYYNFTKNNCTIVAVAAWNKAYPNDKFSSANTPIELLTLIYKKEGYFKFDMSKEVPNIR